MSMESMRSEFARISKEISEGRPADRIFEAEGRTYTRRFVPEERLVILGGGHIAKHLCRMASMIDFSVTVVDDRPQFANEERFPEAARVICDSFENAIAGLGIRKTDYV
ncbi:MAG: XdhC family protein, partial [Lachnospiraceae bacterium]|nr:XdhC family protein [Lachnospiraceae bacterium]